MKLSRNKLTPKKNNQLGFTLIEVLLSIILLSIILTLFMALFTQSSMITKKNEQKLNTIETAQKYINLIDNYISAEDIAENDQTNNVLTTDNSTILIDKATIAQLIETGMSDSEKMNLEQMLNSTYEINAEVTNQCPPNLIQFKIIVKDPQDDNNTTITYTYIQR